MDRAAVVGIGRIGLCLALNLERAGWAVLGVDRNRELVRQVRTRTYRTVEPGVESALAEATALEVNDDLGAVRAHGARTIFVAVDTPTSDVGYDTGHVDEVLRSLVALGPAADPTDVVIACTTWPGYCDTVAPLVESGGYALSYSPGFIAQGSVMRDQQAPAQILIGEADAAAGARLEATYRRLCTTSPPVFRMPPLSAEIAKLATNAYITMKIAFANAIGDLAVRAGGDPRAILAAVGADRRIGTAALQYGFGFGGPCFPRDNRALGAFARSQGIELLQAAATDAMNARHLAFQLDEYSRLPPDQPIHIDGVTYKPGTDILDESQPLALAVALARAGRPVVIHDEPAVVAEVQARFPGLFQFAAPRR
jgi:UDPglucose 6-dehydrogenase